MEASAIHAPAAVGRISISARFLRLRSDEQLVELFRAGHDEAFRVIYDRYRQRLFAYVRQMLSGSRQDAEDATQDVFIRAYGALRANGRPVTLRAWLYRVAHNRCIDQLRRPAPALADVFDNSRGPLRDPLLEAERREDLRRLVADVRRLPDQQRSALLMREMQGMSYAELAGALDTSVAAVKSLLVRARMGLVEAAESRETACVEIRRDLVLSFDRGVRMSGHARRHVRDCDCCREFRGQLRGVRRSMAALVPFGAGPFGILAKLGIGGTGLAASGAASGSGLAVLGAGATVVTATKVAAVLTGATLLSLGPLDPVPAEHHRAGEAGNVSAADTASAEWTHGHARAGASVFPWGAAGAQAAPARRRGHAAGGFISPDIYVYEGRYGRAPHRSPKPATTPTTSPGKPTSTSTAPPTTTKDPLPLVGGLLHPGGSGSGSGSSGSTKSGSGSGTSSGSSSSSTSSNYSGSSSGSGSSTSGTSSSSGSGSGSGSGSTSGSGSGSSTGSTGSGTGSLLTP